MVKNTPSGPAPDNDLAQKIREANIRLHNQKAQDFDREEVHMQKERCIKIARECVDVITTSIETPDPTLLDIGCGTGNLSLMFLQKGYRVTGLDISEGMLDVYRRKCGDSVQTVLSDADAFFAENRQCYDVISFSAVLHHLPEYLDTVRRSLEFLKPSGILFINHEHLSFDTISTPARWLQSLDIHLYGMVYKWRYERSDFPRAIGRKLGLAARTERSDDIRLADFHVFEGGVQEPQIIDELKTAGLGIIRFLPYQQLRFDSLNALAAMLCWHGLFCLIAQKTASGAAGNLCQSVKIPNHG